MRIQPPSRTDFVSASVVAVLACLLWAVSLWLPGFRISGSAEDTRGWLVLLMGLPFAVLVHGWAVYANLFFLWVVTAILLGKRPKWSVFAMLALLATLPLFRGVVKDAGSAMVTPVASWGWGVVAWIAALLLAAMAAALRAGIIGRRVAFVSIALMLATCASVFSLRTQQLSVASVQDRYAYFSPGIAFTVAPLCGVDPAVVEAPLLPEGAIVTLDVDPAQTASLVPYINLSSFSDYQRDGTAWVTYQLERASERFGVRVPYDPDRPVLQVRDVEGGVVLNLLERPGGRVLYSQTLRTMQDQNGWTIHCPASGFDLPRGSGAPWGYDRHLERAIGQDRKKRLPTVDLTPGVADMRCDRELVGDHASAARMKIDGREIVIGTGMIDWSAAFCSEHHLVLLQVSRRGDDDLRKPAVQARVFDRVSLKPQASFFDGGACEHAECRRVLPGDAIRAVRIDERALAIETDAGEFRVAR